MSSYTEDGDYWHDKWEKAQEKIAALENVTPTRWRERTEKAEAENERLQARLVHWQTMAHETSEENKRLRAESDQRLDQILELREELKQCQER